MKARKVEDVTGELRRVQGVPSRRCGKLSYSSRKVAKAVAAQARRETGHEIEAYKCGPCHSWHLGHPVGSYGAGTSAQQRARYAAEGWAS